jgi:hypothetical protein
MPLVSSLSPLCYFLANENLRSRSFPREKNKSVERKRNLRILPPLPWALGQPTHPSACTSIWLAAHTPWFSFLRSRWFKLRLPHGLNCGCLIYVQAHQMTIASKIDWICRILKGRASCNRRLVSWIHQWLGMYCCMICMFYLSASYVYSTHIYNL